MQALFKFWLPSCWVLLSIPSRGNPRPRLPALQLLITSVLITPSSFTPGLLSQTELHSPTVPLTGCPQEFPKDISHATFPKAKPSSPSQLLLTPNQGRWLFPCSWALVNGSPRQLFILKPTRDVCDHCPRLMLWPRPPALCSALPFTVLFLSQCHSQL